MAITLWSPASGMAQIAFIGHVEMRDMHIPRPGKDEWGIDTLDRTVRGPASEFEDYGDGLAQGDEYEVGGNTFYLQTWRPIEHAYFPGYSLAYKGLTPGSLPDPLQSNQFVELVSSTTAESLSVTYGTYEDGTARTVIAASKEVKYIAPQTTWRYLAIGAPTAPSIGTIAVGTSVQIIDSRITLTFNRGNTQVLAGTAPAGVATALASTPETFVVGPSSNPIIGTPYFECEETCRLQYPGS